MFFKNDIDKLNQHLINTEYKLRKTISIFIVLLLIPASNYFFQSKSNLGVFEQLIDKSVSNIDSVVTKSGRNKNIKISVPSSLEQLNPFLISSFKKREFAVNPKEESGYLENFTLTTAAINYRNSFKDGLFGDVFVEREILFEGARFAITQGGFEEPVYFKFSNVDTVNVDDIPLLENKSIPFTQGQIPSPPLLSNLLEPIIVVGTLITSVVLLFTVRSK